LRRFDKETVARMAGHPIQSYKNLMDRRNCKILMFSPNNVDMDVFSGIRYSNLIWLPDFRLGWLILPKSEKTIAGELGFIVHPDIPYTLDIHKSALNVDLNEELTKLKSTQSAMIDGLGLPNNLLKMHCSGLAELAANKWLTGFDAEGGSGMIFLSGVAMGFAFGVGLTLVCYTVLLGLFAKFASG
jgi:hypothetical protein